jgi:hypothetical protein
MRLFLIGCVLAVVACGRGHGEIDELIGAACTSDRDCEQRCFRDGGNKFPGGFCSLECRSDLDCPTDTYCMSTEGGVCLFYCPEFDCSRLGPGWRCRERDRRGGGKAYVCIGD